MIGAAFAFAWYKGYLVKFAEYIRQTREELGKCAWPTWDELKGSTVVITISITILGVFTVAVDYAFYLLVRLITIT